MQLSAIQEIMTQLNIGSKAWDLLLIGDGSGQGWALGCGWASVLIDRHSAQRKLFYGAMNSGTIGIAELFPYVHAMLWYSRGAGKKRLQKLHNQFGHAHRLNVHIITDSEITAKQGNGHAKRHTNTELWAAMDQFTRLGYSFSWHWVERDTIGLNVLTDYLSREARKVMNTIELPKGSSIYDFSPDKENEDNDGTTPTL